MILDKASGLTKPSLSFWPAQVTVRQVFAHPTVSALALVALDANNNGAVESQLGNQGVIPSHGADDLGDEEDVVLVPDPQRAGEPFPLIGIQKAYWIGIQLNLHADFGLSGDTGAPGPSASGSVQPIIFNEFVHNISW